MSEHLLMAYDVGAQEEEPVIVRVAGVHLMLVLDDGRELLLDAREVEQILLPSSIGKVA